MIKNINLDEYKLNGKKLYNSFLPDFDEKKKFNVVYTPFSLINQILDLIPINEYKKKSHKWLDVGSGLGNFALILYEKLYENLKSEFLQESELKDYILNEMIFLSEICESHIFYLKKFFGEKINLFTDFLSISDDYINYFDIIIGNPPYNYGTIKTPTNNNISKKDEGKSIWQNFIIKSLALLKDKGYLCMIVPAIWLKPDKSGIYNILIKYKIIKLHCFSNTQTNKIFNYQAQTPTCFFILQKIPNPDNYINIYDNIYNIYIPYNLQTNYPIPMFFISIINKFLYFSQKYGILNIYKSNSPSVNCNFASHLSSFYSYKGISSCHLTGENKLTPQLIETFSNIPTLDYGVQKIILAHKMYGFPFIDISGSYGISARDNYIIKGYSLNELEKIAKFLSTKTILFIYAATAYRMKYLEKYIFNFIPDISKINFFDNLPDDIDKRDDLLAQFFNLSNIEREIIKKNCKNYKFFH